MLAAFAGSLKCLENGLHISFPLYLDSTLLPASLWFKHLESLTTQLGRAASDILFSSLRIRALTSTEGNYLGKLMLKSWDRRDKTEFGHQRLWDREQGLGLCCTQFYEMLLQDSHCLSKLPGPRLITHGLMLPREMNSDYSLTGNSPYCTYRTLKSTETSGKNHCVPGGKMERRKERLKNKELKRSLRR